VRGFFGDPRTFYAVLAGLPRAGMSGVFSFHNGVDIVARGGTAVVSVVAGTVVYAGLDEIIVAGAHHRRFQYWHLRPRVWAGEHVLGLQTVLGFVRPGAGHVHLTEIRGSCVVNPLASGHLIPYEDPRPPRVVAILLRSRGGRALDPTRISQPFELDAVAEDYPWPSVPGLWHGMPVTPALVQWRLTAAAGAVIVRERTVADFRATIPPNRDFWQVYAAGTHENFPELPGAPQSLQRGRYIFRLTPPSTPLTLRPGSYTVTVTAADTGGNSSTLSLRMVVVPSRTALVSGLATKPPAAPRSTRPEALERTALVNASLRTRP
jgi:hypothetical protein